LRADRPRPRPGRRQLVSLAIAALLTPVASAPAVGASAHAAALPVPVRGPAAAPAPPLTPLVPATAFAPGGAVAAPVAIGARLPDARLDGLRVPARQLAGLRGKPLLINVWASWCGPCRAEMASLDRLAHAHGGRLNVIGVSTDDERADALGLLQASRIGFPNYLDAHLQLENMLGANRIPLTVLVDADGRVRARFYGSRDWDSAASRALIAKALAITL
jgi:thiol-disulfide isomerase/thioredoxin